MTHISFVYVVYIADIYQTRQYFCLSTSSPRVMHFTLNHLSKLKIAMFLASRGTQT